MTTRSTHPPDASKVELGYEARAGDSDAPKRAAPPPARPRGARAVAFGRLRRDRLARGAAVALACLALMAIFADLLASHLPIACRLHGTTYVLPNVTHPPALAGWSNARIAAEATPGDWAIYPPVRFGPKGSPDLTRRAEPLRAPAPFGDHPLGTDAHGRDVFARLVHGARTSIGAALFAALAFVAIGAALGAVAGFFGGAFDAIVARLVETLTAFPTLILVLVIQAVLARATMLTLLLAIALSRWPEVARLVRAEVLLVSSQDYVVAARALGASPWRVLRRHVLPNAVTPLLVAGTFGVGSVVLIEASLDFLRVGIPPSAASWGEMLSETREHMEAWWLLVFPGLAVFVTVTALNLLGEALRDALDPRLRAPLGGVASEAAAASDEVPPSSAAFDETTHA